ncbi:MAG: hypothetical protein RHS_5130 [Robinsoniella sp. RHS]|nr:MAG: hypothetical protein RHS_5130 [Robinsoniella sp. RHS]
MNIAAVNHNALIRTLIQPFISFYCPFIHRYMDSQPSWQFIILVGCTGLPVHREIIVIGYLNTGNRSIFHVFNQNCFFIPCISGCSVWIGSPCLSKTACIDHRHITFTVAADQNRSFLCSFSLWIQTLVIENTSLFQQDGIPRMEVYCIYFFQSLKCFIC